MNNSKDKKKGLFSFFKSGFKEVENANQAQDKNLNAKKLSFKGNIARILIGLGVGLKALFSFKALYSVILIQDMINIMHRHPVGGPIVVACIVGFFSFAFYYNYKDKKKLKEQKKFLQNAIMDAEKNNALINTKPNLDIQNQSLHTQKLNSSL